MVGRQKWFPAFNISHFSELLPKRLPRYGQSVKQKLSDCALS